jgi:DNA-binding MarR family transcriptional regulator
LEGLVGSALVGVARAHRTLVGRGLARLDLYPGQEFLLAQLWDNDGQTQTALAHRLRVEPPTVVKAVQRMAEAGFVTRRRDPRDGRLWRIWLTAAGSALREPVEQVWCKAENRMLNGVSEADRAVVRVILGTCYANLVAEPGDV